MKGFATRLALRAYPPSFRERYGAELETLVADTGTGPRTVANLLAGALLAWVRPVLPVEPSERRRRRLQASVATTWVVWCAGFLVAPSANRALLDPPVPGAGAVVQALLQVAQWSMIAGWILVLIAGIPLGLRVVVSAFRSRDRKTLRPLWMPVILLLIEAAGMGLLVALRGDEAWQPSASFLVVFLLWTVGFAALVVTGGLGPAIALTRHRPDTASLRWPGLLALGVAVALTITTGASVGAVAATAVWGPFTVAVLVVASGASVAALTTSLRGMPVMLAR
jgi:MFS family permease